MLQDKIKNDLRIAMKEKNDFKKCVIRIIMGEMARKTKKEFDDKEVISIIKKLVNSEKEFLKSKSQDTSDFLIILESYLPKLVSEETIKSWIKDNINFSEFKNKMQAMSPIMNNFGISADGNIVKKILLDNF